MTLDPEDLRLTIYGDLARTGQAPTRTGLAARLDLTHAEAHDGLRALAAARHVVLGADDRVLMAHPFATIPLGFSVMGRQTLWWGGCAWDSFALPHLLPDEPEVLVATRCPGCGRALAWAVGRDAPPTGDEVAHFLVPVQRMWDDVVETCANQRLFCGPACVDRWLAARGGPSRATSWISRRYGDWPAEWYEGRLERGYTRREPSAAAAYFREVGLQGPFWGLGA